MRLGKPLWNFSDSDEAAPVSKPPPGSPQTAPNRSMAWDGPWPGWRNLKQP